MTLEFPPDTLPWLDRPSPDIDGYVRELGLTGEHAGELRVRLQSWHDNGFAVLPRAIEPELIDALLGDVARLFAGADRYSLIVDGDTYRMRPIHEVDPTYLSEVETQHQFRLLNFHNMSVAGKQLSLHPTIVEFVSHLFQDRLALFQSLTFLRGSEQALHQDFAYVHTPIPSHLAATWIALEDVHPDSGPLVYIPGSHRIPKFDWGNGILRLEDSTGTDDEFTAHLNAAAHDAGLHEGYFCPKKGDVFVWHAGLIHGGLPVVDPARTRKSYVSHYTSASTFTADYRAPNEPAEAFDYNGGVVFRNPLDPSAEDTFPYPR